VTATAKAASANAMTSAAARRGLQSSSGEKRLKRFQRFRIRNARAGSTPAWK
jgi:hypothetical protein